MRINSWKVAKTAYRRKEKSALVTFPARIVSIRRDQFAGLFLTVTTAIVAVAVAIVTFAVAIVTIALTTTTFTVI
jgi:hypothetical protein